MHFLLHAIDPPVEQPGPIPAISPALTLFGVQPECQSTDETKKDGPGIILGDYNASTRSVAGAPYSFSKISRMPFSFWKWRFRALRKATRRVDFQSIFGNPYKSEMWIATLRLADRQDLIDWVESLINSMRTTRNFIIMFNGSELLGSSHEIINITIR